MQLGCPVTRRRALQDMETVQTFLASTLIPNSSEPNSLANNTGVFPRDIEIDKGTTTQKACVSPPQLRRLIEASCVTIQKPTLCGVRDVAKGLLTAISDASRRPGGDRPRVPIAPSQCCDQSENLSLFIVGQIGRLCNQAR
jgi:hypothetical protein